ncbi:hypothetical protein Tco_0891028 [Tanacetum coccineum]|uniref:Uncharacterized protein n=1 Tax=Tanacetum coccineum TaxID=301880 RepID=A0ABQ5C544_9ASTR
MARSVHLDELAEVVKSTLIKDQMLMYLDRVVAEDVKLAKQLKIICFDLTKNCNERGALIEELEKLKGLVDTPQSAAFLNDIQRRDVEKATSLLIMVKETQLRTCEKENEYAKLWYKKYEECKYDKILYDKAYTNMQHQIERLQAQLGDIKGKSSSTQCASNNLDPLSQKLEDENVSLEFQVLNYAKENAYLKTTYKNFFDSINVTQA